MKFAILLLLLLQSYLTELAGQQQRFDTAKGAYKYLKGFERTHGASHFDAYNSAHGHKDDKMYKSNHYRKKGLRADFEKGFDQEKFAKNYGDKKFDLHPKKLSAASRHGAEFGEKERYKNYNKKAGYGELYDLDALNKNRAFYEKANKEGHYKKYGNARKFYENSERGEESGGSRRNNQQSNGYKIIKR